MPKDNNRKYRYYSIKMGTDNEVIDKKFEEIMELMKQAQDSTVGSLDLAKLKRGLLSQDSSTQSVGTMSYNVPIDFSGDTSSSKTMSTFETSTYIDEEMLTRKEDAADNTCGYFFSLFNGDLDYKDDMTLNSRANAILNDEYTNASSDDGSRTYDSRDDTDTADTHSQYTYSTRDNSTWGGTTLDESTLDESTLDESTLDESTLDESTLDASTLDASTRYDSTRGDSTWCDSTRGDSNTYASYSVSYSTSSESTSNDYDTIDDYSTIAESARDDLTTAYTGSLDSNSAHECDFSDSISCTESYFTHTTSPDIQNFGKKVPIDPETILKESKINERASSNEWAKLEKVDERRTETYNRSRISKSSERLFDINTKASRLSSVSIAGASKSSSIVSAAKASKISSDSVTRPPRTSNNVARSSNSVGSNLRFQKSASSIRSPQSSSSIRSPKSSNSIRSPKSSSSIHSPKSSSSIRPPKSSSSIRSPQSSMSNSNASTLSGRSTLVNGKKSNNTSGSLRSTKGRGKTIKSLEKDRNDNDTQEIKNGGIAISLKSSKISKNNSGASRSHSSIRGHHRDSSLSLTSSKNSHESAREQKTTQDSSLSTSKGDKRNGLVNGNNMKCLNYDIEPVLLYRAIDTKQWKLALNRIKRYPEEARTWVFRLDQNEETLWKFLPIHAACFSGAPGEVVRELISMYPESVRVTTCGAKLPIHIACETGARRDVVVNLVKAYPDSLCIAECYGNTPLELCKNSSNRNKAQIMKILTKPGNIIPGINQKKKFKLFKKFIK